MKKLLAMLLTLVMVLSVTTLSWAEERVVPVYPKGVTKDSFDSAETVYYTNNLGEVKTGGTEDSEKTALVAYVGSDNTVQYAADIWAAIKNGASTVYCKEGAAVRMRQRAVDTNRTPDLIADLTIYANGADFQYGEISMNMTNEGKAASITVKVYDAKNIFVWGNTPNAGVTQTIIMDNCANVGESANNTKGRMFYLNGATGTVNATLTNCSIKATDTGIYMGCDGNLTVENSEFDQCLTAIKVSYKGEGTRTNSVKDCEFTNCGATDEQAGDTEWMQTDRSAIKIKNGGTGTLTATIDNATITGTVGGKGDIQIESKSATNPAGVTVKNTTASVSVTKPGASDAAVTEVKTVTKDDTLTITNDGGAQVTQPETPPRYYYNSTTTDTKANGTKGSPKTFDAGMGVYALTTVLSVTGMAYVGKKKF